MRLFLFFTRAAFRCILKHFSFPLQINFADQVSRYDLRGVQGLRHEETRIYGMAGAGEKNTK